MDLSDADLTGSLFLRGSLLRYADLSGANLSSTNLWAADLTDTKLWGAVLHYANLTGATLEGADLTLAYMDRVRVSDMKGCAIRPRTLTQGCLAADCRRPHARRRVRRAGGFVFPADAGMNRRRSRTGTGAGGPLPRVHGPELEKWRAPARRRQSEQSPARRFPAGQAEHGPLADVGQEVLRSRS